MSINVTYMKNIISNKKLSLKYNIKKEYKFIMSKKNLIKGTIFLTITGFVTRLLGFYNRIFLTRLIGVKELGIYQLIFPIYIFSYALCAQGISLSEIKNISYYSGKNDICSCQKIFKSSIKISLVLSLFVSSLIFLFAPLISKVILSNNETTCLLRIICLAIPFVAVKSCLNSYFVGHQMPFVQGTSHLYEQILRITATYILFCSFFKYNSGAKIAVIAVVIGEIAATLYSYIYYRYKNKKLISANSNCFDNSSTKISSTTKQLIKDAIPLSINNILLTLFSATEALILPAMLLKYYNSNEIAIYIYGIVSGIVLPFLMFPSTITNSLSTMLIPSVSNAVSSNNKAKIKTANKNTIAFCCLLGILSWLFFYIFGDFACKIAFHDTNAGKLLSRIGFLCPLLYLANTQSAIMTGLGKNYKNLVYNILSISLRIIIIFNYVPLYGISAYIFALLIGYLVQNILMLISANHME